MIRVAVEGVGLCGPGLDGWTASLPVLSGATEHSPTPIRVPPTTLLPPNERRRAVQTVRLTLAVGAEAFAAAGRDAGATATIFTSSGGDGDTIHEILSVLASPHRELSPTRFHNSVHNTPAGYWGIATESRAPSSSLCGHDDSFAAGLLEAAVQAATERRAVTLIAYDVQYPAPISAVRPIGAPFAVALILTPAPTAAAIGSLTLRLQPKSGAVSVVAAPTLEALRRTTPAARSLPLLVALARRTAATVTLDYLGDLDLTIDVTPPTEIVTGVERSESVAG
jgi:Beta-ketoacyl synthase, N-terminal domain